MDYEVSIGGTENEDTQQITVGDGDIDTTAPVITLSADTETVVRQTPITATVDDGSTIQYRIGEFGLWKEYKEPIIASLNETYYFMAMDDAGNIGTNQITFGNIDTSGVLLSTLWTQKGICPMGGNTTILYNEYTPLDPSVTPEAHSLTGCVNTAAGQLIYYFIEKKGFDLPLTLDEKDEYTSKHKATEEGGDPIVIPIKADGTTPGTLSFAEINAMLSDYQLDSAEHAAALLYAIGVVLESKYSANSTGTSWNRVFFKRAGFEGETMGGPYFGEYYWGDMDDEMQYTITDAGFEVLIENLEAGLPVGATYPGHAFVIDGYDRESDTFHINLGWGGNQATRWYTRDEMQEELNCEYFVYDLNPEYVETFTVTDARVYGTGTMIRAFERAAGMIGDNTVAFDPSVAGKTVELLNHITFFDEVISVKDFNMNVLVTESQGGENSYGFYADHLDVFEPTDPATVLTFHASGGSLIVSTEKESNYAFQMQDGLSCTVDANDMLIYAGKTSEGTSAAAVLEALQTNRSDNTEVSGDLLDPNGWSYNGSAGEDVFRLSNSSLAVGKVSLGGGDDVLSLTGHSRLYGSIDAGEGNDSITVDSTSSIRGDLAGTCNLNFVLAERDDHAMFTIQSSVSGLCADTTVSVDMSNAEVGAYTLISAASGATGISELQNLTVTVTGSGIPDFTLSVNGTSTSDYADLIFEDNSLKLQVKKESEPVDRGNHSMENALFIDIEKLSGASQSNLTVHDSGVDDYYKVVLPDTGLDGDYFVLRFPVDVDLDLYVLDAESNTVVKSTSAENFEDVSFRGLAAGTYYIQVTAPFAAIGEYILSWHFTFNNVAPDDLEGMEPYVITGSTELTGLTISAANAETDVTQEDTFKLTLEQGGNADSKIRFGDYRADWKGLKYILKDGTGETVRDGIGAEISLNGLAAGEYMLTVDTPVEGAYSAYSLSVSLPEPPAKKWTYMVYFASDNNLGTWSMYDLILMQQAVLNPGIDIYVLYDRPSGNDNTQEYATVHGIYRMDSEWDDTRVGKVSYDPGLTVSVNWDESWGTKELDTGSADTLERFVDWVQTQSDADCFGLIMWDHGAENGWLCFDDTPAPGSSEGTNLAISDVADVLKDKDNIPIVIFNNCLLGSELVVTQMTGATDVIVISEPVSFAASTYDYKDFFETITADMTPQEMAEIMVRNAQHQATGINLDPTMLSSVDVRGTELHDALEALADAVVEANNETDIKVLINAMKKAAQDGCLYDASRTQQSDLYDMILQAMADRNYENTSEGFQTALGNLKKAIESVVLDFRSVPADRGYGIAFDNVVHTAMKVLGKGASSDKTEEYIKAYLDDFYTSNPAWAGLLFEVGKAYLAENGQSTFRSATFDVTENSDLVKGKTVRVSDLGCFSGQGAVFNGISLIGDYFFHIVITDEKYSTGAFRVANDSGAAVTVSLLSGDGSVVKSGTDSVSFNDLEVGDYYIRLQSEKDCDVTLSFEADWTTGVDRFDYAVTKVNEKNADGNGTPEKATSLSEGYHPGLLTGKGDVDLYRIGNSHAQSYAVVLECTEDVDVAICKGNMKVVKRPRGAYGLYSMQVSSGYYLSVTAKDDQDESKVVNYSLFITENETPEEEIIVISDLVGTPDGVSWGSSVPTAQYNVEFSRDDFANVFLMTTNGRVIDTPELPAGTWQWRVKPNDEYLLTSYDWTVGNEIVSKTDESTPKVVRSNEDGNCEIFFASPNGTWSKLYYAKHVGSLNDEWKGTNEMVSANGKGRIQNLYFGSADMNVLCLTDKENGDAIFLDDVYTERPEEIEEDVARLSRIETILAGAGDDIVDMTSQQFAYVGGDMIIRGGDGDDVIWAGKGSNQLFGDAGNDRIVGASGRDLIVGGSGNDRMHGGGGNDIFTFCDNWGVDEVEQLDGGSVTLWFKSGDESKWNASELIYTDGDNSVTVKGVTSVTLRFGSEVDGDLYAELCDAKAFDAFSSRTVFDVEPVGYLANA